LAFSQAGWTSAGRAGPRHYGALFVTVIASGSGTAPQARAHEMAEDFRLKDRWISITHAMRGLGHLLASQHNARLHALATGLALFVAVWLDLNRLEWLVLVLTIAAVWCAEAFNTALELLADAASPEFHPLVGKAKDVAAGAVLIAAIAAVVVAALILVPRLF
jgi:diacylglycerol kinase (ATP)